VADPGAAARFLATLTCAFINDPPFRSLYPEPNSYLLHYPVFGGGAFELGTAWRSEDFGACALWYPPGNENDEKALIAVIAKAVAPGRRAEVIALFEAIGEVHPTEPHWYLALIGVEAASQGYGLGAMLLRTTLALCDRDGLPAYPEASNPRNIPFYERHGFRLREFEPRSIFEFVPISRSSAFCSLRSPSVEFFNRISVEPVGGWCGFRTTVRHHPLH
jgi:GNAT superfamily N-acetyltransferase